MRAFALAAAVVALTACSHTTATPAAPTTVTHPAAAVRCSRQYEAWKQGPAKKLVAELNAIESANRARDMAALVAALKKARPALATATKDPMPACADSKGYWTVLLMHVNAAAANTRSAPGWASNIRAALNGMPEIEGELSAEMKSAAG